MAETFKDFKPRSKVSTQTESEWMDSLSKIQGQCGDSETMARLNDEIFRELLVLATPPLALKSNLQEYRLDFRKKNGIAESEEPTSLVHYIVEGEVEQPVEFDSTKLLTFRELVQKAQGFTRKANTSFWKPDQICPSGKYVILRMNPLVLSEAPSHSFWTQFSQWLFPEKQQLFQPLSVSSPQPQLITTASPISGPSPQLSLNFSSVSSECWDKTVLNARSQRKEESSLHFRKQTRNTLESL
eukprot:TRINITY_DN5651_c0_g3_i2.p1 TRINITY_DN5651_c0_g3~~TRINITY_DN5651_c0_g3_i2.p1  ORF type:complete len:242 (+),score=11.84 TRINITY_DN5651_c0_g3_i2:401-1126(+)